MKRYKYGWQTPDMIKKAKRRRLLYFFLSFNALTLVAYQYFTSEAERMDPDWKKRTSCKSFKSSPCSRMLDANNRGVGVCSVF